MFHNRTINTIKRRTDKAILVTIAVEWHEQVVRREAWIPLSCVTDSGEIKQWFAAKKYAEVIASTNLPDYATPILYTL
jgi:hypothetical protein